MLSLLSLIWEYENGGSLSQHSVLLLFVSIMSCPIQCCSRHLQSNEEGEGAVVQSLCALVLLEGSSPRQVFTRFLLARKVGKGEGRGSGGGEDGGSGWVRGGGEDRVECVGERGREEEAVLTWNLHPPGCSSGCVLSKQWAQLVTLSYIPLGSPGCWIF